MLNLVVSCTGFSETMQTPEDCGSVVAGQIVLNFVEI